MTREFTREEKDGSKTITYAIENNGVLQTHNNKGAAITNKEQEVEDYYLYGTKLTKEVWEKRKKLS